MGEQGGGSFKEGRKYLCFDCQRCAMKPVIGEEDCE